MISEISCSLLAIVAERPVPLCPTLWKTDTELRPFECFKCSHVEKNEVVSVNSAPSIPISFPTKTSQIAKTSRQKMLSYKKDCAQSSCINISLRAVIACFLPHNLKAGTNRGGSKGLVIIVNSDETIARSNGISLCHHFTQIGFTLYCVIWCNRTLSYPEMALV